MKNSRTSTNKNVKKTNNKSSHKVSTSPSRTNAKPKKNIKRNRNSKSNVHTNNVKKNNHSAKNNLRLNKVVQDVEYVPFFDNEDIIPNNIRKVQPQEKKDEENLKKKTKIKASTVIKFTLFIAIVVVILYLMFNYETFNLTEIKVSGNEKYTAEEIVSNSNLNIGENVFKQLFYSLNTKIDLSYISKSSFSYSFPSTIVINVEERYPAYIALDKNSGKYYKIDNDGYLLEQCELTSKEDELLIEGLVFGDNPQMGEKINEVYINKLDIYNNIKILLDKYQIIGNITKVNFSNSLTTITIDDKLNVVFANDSNLEYKVSFLKGILQENDQIVDGTIDMSIENPVYSKYD